MNVAFIKIVCCCSIGLNLRSANFPIRNLVFNIAHEHLYIIHTRYNKTKTAEIANPRLYSYRAFYIACCSRTLWTWFKTLNSHFANFVTRNVAFSGLKIALRARENHRTKHTLSPSLSLSSSILKIYRRGIKRNSIRIYIHRAFVTSTGNFQQLHTLRCFIIHHSFLSGRVTVNTPSYRAVRGISQLNSL